MAGLVLSLPCTNPEENLQKHSQKNRNYSCQSSVFNRNSNHSCQSSPRPNFLWNACTLESQLSCWFILLICAPVELLVHVKLLSCWCRCTGWVAGASVSCWCTCVSIWPANFDNQPKTAVTSIILLSLFCWCAIYTSKALWRITSKKNQRSTPRNLFKSSTSSIKEFFFWLTIKILVTTGGGLFKSC